MKKSPSLHQLLFEQQVFGVLLFSFVVITVWVISAVYFSYSKDPIPSQEQIHIESIDPTIDERVLLPLLQRRWWTPEELQDFPVSIVIKKQ